VSGDFIPVYLNNFRLLLRYVVPVCGTVWLSQGFVCCIAKCKEMMNVRVKPMLTPLTTSETFCVCSLSELTCAHVSSIQLHHMTVIIVVPCAVAPSEDIQHSLWPLIQLILPLIIIIIIIIIAIIRQFVRSLQGRCTTYATRIKLMKIRVQNKGPP